MTSRKETKELFFKNGICQLEVELLYNSQYEIIEIIDLVEKSFGKVSKFYFQFAKGPIRFTLIIVYSRAEYDEIAGYKSERWASGYSHEGKVAIFHPDLFETETTHKREDFAKTLTHEIAHIFDKFIFKDYLWWIHEGVAQYIANQSTFKKLETQNIDHFLENNFLRNDNYREFAKEQGHQISKQLVFKIAKEKGARALFELSKIKPDNKSRAQIAEICGVGEKYLEKKVKEILSQYR